MSASVQTILLRKDQWRPHLNRAIQCRQLGRHHSDNGVLLSVQRDCLVNNTGICAEASPPEFIAKYNYVFTACYIFAGKKASAQSWFHSQHVKIVCPNVYTGYALWSIATFKIKTREEVCGDTGEDGVLIFPIFEC